MEAAVRFLWRGHNSLCPRLRRWVSVGRTAGHRECSEERGWKGLCPFPVSPSLGGQGGYLCRSGLRLCKARALLLFWCLASLSLCSAALGLSRAVKLFACLFFGSTPSSSQRHRLLPWSRMKAVDHGHLVSSVEGQEPVLCLAFSLPLWS